MSKKTLPKTQEFMLTEFQRGVIKTLNDVANYLDQTHVLPIRKSISVTLTQYAQEHFNYPEGTNLQFDIDPESDLVKVEVQDAKED